MSIQWREEMAIDHGLVDQDHQVLINIINEFTDLPKGEATLTKLRQILQELHHYTEVHFSREETLQRAVHYIFAEAHHHEHLDLIKQLRAIEDRMSAAEAGTAPSAPPHAEISAFLRDWIVGHVIGSDLRMKPYAAQLTAHSKRMAPLLEQAGPRQDADGRPITWLP